VCFTELFFSSGIRGAIGLLRAAATGGWAQFSGANALAAAVIAFSLSMTTLLLWHRITVFAWLDRLGKRLIAAKPPLGTMVLGETALVVFLLVLFWAVGQRDPVVVYIRF
jgi:hypothetical protein